MYTTKFENDILIMRDQNTGILIGSVKRENDYLVASVYGSMKVDMKFNYLPCAVGYIGASVYKKRPGRKGTVKIMENKLF